MIASLLLLAFSHGYTLKEGVTPVQKVIQMLHEMSAKGAAEKAHEAEIYAQYSESHRCSFDPGVVGGEVVFACGCAID